MHFEDVLVEATRLRAAVADRSADLGIRAGLSALEYGNAFLLAPRYAAYQHVPDECRLVAARIAGLENGAALLQDYLRLVTTEQVLLLPRRLEGWRLPPRIMALIWKTMDRLLAEVRSERDGFFTHENDLFVKDFAVCRLKLLPCGVETVDTGAGIARSTIWSSGRRHIWPVARAFVEMGGFRPYLEGHWDRRSIREFNVAGYRNFYANAAELMIAHPEFRGLGGRSWWFDPALEHISPELAFLRETAKAGGVFVPVETDAGMAAQALRMSSRRKSLHAEGKYTPQNTLWIWPRRRVLAWAERYG